jgi:DNA invertase Pin-like site-specific DNA recombinase
MTIGRNLPRPRVSKLVREGRFIAYYRVSTARQGKSGLGLEAQRQAVREHLNGGNWRLVAEVTEIESGKRLDRPKLAEALKMCRLQGAKLIIAKLDRLARNVAFISKLMAESNVEFEAVDFPQASRLTLHIMAAIAEHEAKMISDRTRVALAAAKARGPARRFPWPGRYGSRLRQSTAGSIGQSRSPGCRPGAGNRRHPGQWRYIAPRAGRWPQ